MNTLTTKQAREEWEDVFYQHYISPVLSNLESNIPQAIASVVQNNPQSKNYYCITIIPHF